MKWSINFPFLLGAWSGLEAEKVESNSKSQIQVVTCVAVSVDAAETVNKMTWQHLISSKMLSLPFSSPRI